MFESQFGANFTSKTKRTCIYKTLLEIRQFKGKFEREFEFEFAREFARVCA